MPSITVTVSDEVSDRILTAFSYSTTLPNGSPNPEGPGAFCKRMVKSFLQQTVLTYERNKAAEQAAAATQPVDIA